MVELDASGIYGEAPSNESGCFIASFHKRGQFSFQRVDVGYAPFGTAVMHGGELDLRHIQPTAVLRREVPFDPIEQPTGLVRGERFVKRRPDACSDCPAPSARNWPQGRDDIEQPLDTPGEVLHRSLLGDHQFAPTALRFAESGSGWARRSF